MEILFSEEHLPEEALTALMEQAGVLCGEREGLDPQRLSVSVTFVEPEEIQRLNREYREVDQVTDVLSFPQFEDWEEMEALPEEEPICLGDVVICTERALAQAEEFDHPPQRELVYLFVHSMFHLLGYDHMEEEDKKEMRAAEEEIMEQLALSR